MHSLDIEIISGELVLEAKLELPDGPGPFPGVVLCHPHPLMGGDMYNNVIRAVGKALTERDIAGLRFNFRGTGKSGGRFDNGVGEREDVLSALVSLSMRDDIDPDKLGIMGYSFGGMVAMTVGKDDIISKAVALVSPVMAKGAMTGCAKPKYIICGSADSVVSFATVTEEAKKMPVPKKIEVMQGADHFWLGFEEEMADKVARFFKEVLA